jgi:hypothetical protein
MHSLPTLPDTALAVVTPQADRLGLSFNHFMILCALNIAGMPQSAAQLTADCNRRDSGAVCDDLRALRLGGYVRNIEAGWVLTSAGHEVVGDE